MKSNPTGERRNPFHVFLFAVAALNGALMSFGIPTSSAIDDQLPYVGQHLYGGVLLLGAGSVLLGMYWPGSTRDGLLIKRFGYVALTVATLVYSLAVTVTQPGVQGFLAASVTFTFSIICAFQVHRLSKRVQTIIVLTQELGSNNE